MASSRTTNRKIIVEPLDFAILVPHIKSRDARELLPKTGIFPLHARIIIHGLNNAYANAIRRILCDEIENLALVLDKQTWITDDEFLIVELIASRVMLMPLVQDYPGITVGARFTLDAKNDTELPRDILTKEFILPNKMHSPPFFDTISLFSLNPHRTVHFTARVERSMGHAAYSSVSKAVCIPLDERPQKEDDYVDPILPYSDNAKYLESASICNPYVNMLDLELTGTHKINALLVRVITILRERVGKISKASILQMDIGGTIATGELMTNAYEIRMQGETHTIGCLFTRTCLEIFPKIESATWNVEDVANELVIKIRTVVEPVEKVVAQTIQTILGNLTILGEQFEHLPVVIKS
jgi:DNA-directed RNA polymerase subunit L